MFEIASVKANLGLCIFLQETSRENEKDIPTVYIEVYPEETFLEKELMIGYVRIG